MKHLFSIRERERTWRVVIIALIIACFGFAGYTFYTGNKVTEEAKKNIYVLVNDKALARAKSTDITDSYNILTKGAIQHFNQLIYEQVPDIKQINVQLREASSISDKSTLNLIDSYKQNNFFNSIVSQNYFTILTADSIVVGYNMEPHPFVFYGQLKVIRGPNSSLRSIVTKGYIQSTGRSSIGNERGFYITNFALQSDKEIIQ